MEGLLGIWRSQVYSCLAVTVNFQHKGHFLAMRVTGGMCQMTNHQEC